MSLTRWSDTQVFQRAESDAAYRRFLGLGREDHLPDVSTLYRYNGEVFRACLLFLQCSAMQQKFGRTVRKNEYAAEFDRVRKRA